MSSPNDDTAAHPFYLKYLSLAERLTPLPSSPVIQLSEADFEDEFDIENSPTRPFATEDLEQMGE